ncbi:hypothetical protein GE21DRAFT_1072598 [Neurospora crassa]|nr:hypothetical protein GE21DRAFT_1072598 [Neurospora crassa]
MAHASACQFLVCFHLTWGLPSHRALVYLNSVPSSHVSLWAPSILYILDTWCFPSDLSCKSLQSCPSHVRLIGQAGSALLVI